MVLRTPKANTRMPMTVIALCFASKPNTNKTIPKPANCNCLNRAFCLSVILRNL